jgi:hypothetical protein
MVPVILLGVVAGYLSGGRVGRLADLRLNRPHLLVLAAVGALVFRLSDGVSSGGPADAVLLAVVGLPVLAFLAVNARAQSGGVRMAFILMTGGWLFNLAVIVVNDGMPTPTVVLEGSAWWPNLWVMPHLQRHVQADDASQLAWLADSIQLKLPWFVMPVSVGDVLLYVGGMLFLARGMCGHDAAAEPATL